MANWDKLTAKQFSAIKLLLKGGATQAEAASYMQVSANTVFWISKAETFEEYQTIKAEKELKQKKAFAAKKEAEEKAKAAQVAATVAPQPAEVQKTQEVVKEIRQTVTVQATHYMMQELQKTNELLKSISVKLGYIVEDLYGKKEG